MTFTLANLAAAEAVLTSQTYLASAEKPTTVDAALLALLRESKTIPNVATHPALYGWYSFVGLFTAEAIKLWAEGVAAVAATAPVVAAKKDDDDLFGSDDEEDEEAAAAAAAKRKADAEKAKNIKKKEKPVAKTIIVFEVKVYEQEQDLDELAKKIFSTINFEGLVWNPNYQLLPVAYGMKKLSIGMVVEDDKVLSDDVFDQITAWDDIVQSVDISNMQKV